MDTRRPKHGESAGKKAKAAIEDSFGLPPGDKTPHGEGRPARDPKAPHGTLTADDAKAVPVHKGTGIAVE
jgi:hypothetical protein